MNLPKTIQIGPLEYSVETVKNLHSNGRELYGHVIFGDTAIRIDEDYADTQRTPFILWHEVIHAILDHAGLEVENEEQITTVIAFGVVDVLKRNVEMRLNGDTTVTTNI